MHDTTIERSVRGFIPVTSCGPLGSRRRLRVEKPNKKQNPR